MSGDYGNKVMVTYMETICRYRTTFLNQKVSTYPKFKILKIKKDRSKCNRHQFRELPTY